MNTAPMFSVIVPVYQVEDYLEQYVRSLMNQTYPNIEIILVDDGSSDRSGLMCDEYAKEDCRIRVLHKPNGGQAEARNIGIRMATGHYLLFVDGDDYVSPDYCRKLLPFAKENCDIIVVDAKSGQAGRKMQHYVGDHQRVFTGQEYLLAAYRSGAMPMAAVLYLYKRSFWQEKKLSFRCGIVHEDDHLASRAFLLADRVIDSGLCEYTYRLRDNSTTTRKDLRQNGRDLYGVCLELREIFEDIENRELKNRMIDALVVKYLHIFQVGRLYRYGGEFIH